MRVKFTDQMGRYEKGQRVDLPDGIARRAIKIGRAVPDKEARVETATRGPTETAAKRTQKPQEHGWEYRGHGWWKSPAGEKVRAPKDATTDELMSKIED